MRRSIQRVGILDAGSDISDDLQRWLLQHGYLADVMRDTTALETYCTQLQPAAIIMEVCPERSQVTELITRLRQAGYAAPIIVTSSQRDDELQVKALQLGADDFLQMPVDSRQLFERLELVLRKGAETEEEQAFAASDQLGEVLTAMERRILKTLEEHMPDPLSRETIMWEVKRQRIAPDDRSVDVYISNIRRKLRLVQSPLVIETVRGVGFSLRRDTY